MVLRAILPMEYEENWIEVMDTWAICFCMDGIGGGGSKYREAEVLK
jgi:hypothetical protein